MQIVQPFILITRHSAGNDELLALLHGKVKRVWRWDSFEFRKNPHIDWLNILKDKDWVILTSAASAEFFLQSVSVEQIKHVRLACVGPKTAEVVTQKGFVVDLLSQEHSAKGLAQEAVFQNAQNLKILCLMPDDGQLDFYECLKNRHTIESVAHYHKQHLPMPTDIKDSLRNQKINLVLFYSPSVVRAFFQELADDAAVLSSLKFAVIGKTTQAQLADLGWSAAYCADNGSTPSLFQKIFSPMSSE